MEKGIHRIIILRRDRIELVVMADGAAGREAHPDLHRRGGAVDRVAIGPLLGDAAALARGDIAAIESRGNELLAGRVGEQIARELPAGEFVKRQVRIKRLHDPVAVGPHGALVVEMKSVGVGIAGKVEPVTGHVLTVSRAGQETVDESLVGRRRSVLQESLDLRRRRRQAGQIERNAANERLPIRLASTGKPFFFQLIE